MRWTESITIDAEATTVMAAVADQHHVMAWSAWPQATGFTCSVDGDGVSPGSEIVFRDKAGTARGRQAIVEVEDLRVANRLENQGPFGRTMRPAVDFVVEPLGPQLSQVSLIFNNVVPLPFGLRHVVGLAMGRWVRGLHVKDLRMLKEYVESGRSQSSTS